MFKFKEFKMYKFILPIFFCLCACAPFGIKETDTIADAEMKVIHGLETQAGVVRQTPAQAGTTVVPLATK